ncbi:peptidase A24 [Microbacterium sp. Root166]|uniref:prepilin peptidase n=1 Tax=Microbacterium sp. Root166 TaxID=1736478 RepID=UPI0006F55FCE|nr:A24 family peptidase [Microbacterium sp. Root166]KQZ83958.1 peptidase A24 [Microbacterium sp. Root166]
MTPLTAFIVVTAGVFGLLIGSFLNVVAYRVPAGISLLRESRCPQCDAAVKPWQNVPVVSWLALRGRCAACHSPIAPRYAVVEGITGLAFAAIAWWALTAGLAVPATSSPQIWADALIIIAFLYFAAISIVLTLIDLDTHRLPNAIVLPSYLVAGVLLTAASALSGDWIALLRAAIGMVSLYAFYFLLRLARPGGMGGGDVKLAGVVGLYLGFIGWGALVVGAFAAFVLGGVFGLALIALRRAGRKTAIPFGPWMIAGAWVGIFTGEALARWYMELFASV